MSTFVEATAVMTVSLLVVAASASAQPATFATQPYPFLGNTHVAADLNSDGFPDLVGTGGNAVAIMLNSGNASGAFGPKVSFPVGAPSQDAAASDFNGDVIMDLAVTINSPQISLSLLIGNGDGTFAAPANFPSTSGADSPCIIATDLNNDGKRDLVISHEIACFTAPCAASQQLSVMLGNGNGTFQSLPDITVGTGMHRLADGDFNRDGLTDLAICGDNTRLYILLGAGNGTFAQQPTIFLVPGGDLFSASSDVAVADFNQDGNQDVAVTLPGNGRGTAIVIGNGNGTFAAPFRILDRALDFPQDLAVVDFNLDGFLDIARAMGNGNEGLFDILHGNGNATFQPSLSYLVPPPQSSIGGGFMVAGDFNGDAKPDIALSVIGASPGLRIAINTTDAAAQCPADIFPTGGAGDGTVGPADLGQLLSSWGQCPGACPADLFPIGAPDGIVSAGDLGQLLSQWGRCP